jgi:uncharacterized protein
MDDLLERVRAAIKDRIEESTQSVAHRFDHLARVMQNAQRIAATIDNVDREVLELAVLLHDVDQPVGKKRDHVALSVKAAEDILDRVGYSRETAAKVLQVISEHSSEHVEAKKPTSVEAKILFDADKVDGLGAIGITRVFSLFGQMNSSAREAIAWYRKKIDISFRHLQTEEGMRLCQARLPLVLQFLDQLESELAQYRE